jgi:crotonobetainyl-CoA:carnitine CoA-transferase CaiB-like acyl-CoA transferase
MGDPSRLAYPFVNHESCHFLTVNRNKKSIALNLRRAEGREVFLKLAATADVMLESFKPGYADEIGIGYKDLRETNPRLVYCSLSGYGQTGPDTQRAGHDINIAALSGLLALMPPSGPPVLAGVQFADLTAGLFAAIGILAALVQRASTGTGMYLDVSMLDSLVSLLGPSAAALLGGKPASESYKHLIGQAPAYNLYRTSDGRYMALGAIEPVFWTEFCQAIGCEHLTTKQFPDENERETVIAEVQRIFAQRTQAAWIEFFRDKNVCCEPVNSLEEALAHPTIRQRGMIFYVDHPTAGCIGQVGQPIQFRGNNHHLTVQDTQKAVSPPPLLGQHTLEIMRELGYQAEEIDRLRQKKIIATPDDIPPREKRSPRGPVG